MQPFDHAIGRWDRGSEGGADGGAQGAMTERASRSAADLYATFGASGRTPREAAVRERAEHRVAGALRPDPGLTRLLAATEGTRVVGLASSDSVCLHIEDAQERDTPPTWSTGSCARLEDPMTDARPLTSTTVIGPDRWLFTALIPDGIGTVALSTDRFA